MQTSYSRLTDAQWEYIKKFLNWKRKRELSLRDVLDAIFYVTKTGIQWRELKETKFPDWTAVYYYYDKWKNNGTIEAINEDLLKVEREQLGRKPSPSLGLVDSQSIKLAPMIGEQRGIDGHKKVNGRKRHILSDVRGRIYKAYVHAANLHDSTEGINLLPDNIEQKMESSLFCRLETVLTDKTYRGTFATKVAELDIKFEIPNRPEGVKGFVVEAKRWVVERSFAWLNFYRRVVIDYERTTKSAETFLLLANISMIIPKIKFNAI